MYTEISQMEPHYPSRTEELEDMAREVVAVSAQLESRLSPITLAEIQSLLRIVNSYYSNLIEGHSTHPVDIERGMRQDYSDDQDKRDLQLESEIHIGVQSKIAERLQNEPQSNVTSVEFLCWIHQEFYQEMPERLRWVKGENGERARVEAGALRDRNVQVGYHLAPAPKSLGKFLHRFQEVFDPAKLHGLRPVITLAAAHHRLTWIHPFLDGNGRVARLFTDAYFQRIKLHGYGLWNVSRGLARRRDEYRQYLAAADAQRQGDHDGRGNLSDRTLTQFCRFFLESCLDQAEYMNGLLSLNHFLNRLEKYVELRKAGMIVDSKGQPLSLLPSRVANLLKEVAIKGEISRGEVFSILEKSERTGRNILKGLLDEGLLTSPSEKGLIRLGVPAQAASHWFPDLYPQQPPS